MPNDLNSAQQAAENIKKYVDESDGDEIASRVIARFISDALGVGWQPCSVHPAHDGVETPLFVASRLVSSPRRAYYKNGWRDERGNPMSTPFGSYWIEFPALPEQRFASIAEMRDTFIVEAGREELAQRKGKKQ